MLDHDKEAYLKTVYYDPAHPVSYSSNDGVKYVLLHIEDFPNIYAQYHCAAKQGKKWLKQSNIFSGIVGKLLNYEPTEAPSSPTK